MRILVKICGVTTPEALDAVVAAGADAIGFVFHESSPRNIEPRNAAALARRLPCGVRSVAVMLRPCQEDVDRLLDAFVPDVWQSDAGALDALELPVGIELWPVFRHAGPVMDAMPRRVVFDAAASGRGLQADWQCAAALTRRCELVLAGGLDASNVGVAIAAVQPFGVDVSSGVERAPGVKDVARIRDFVAAARIAMRERCA